MPSNVTQKLIQSHLVEGKPRPGEEIGLKIDQTLTQDATGTLVMLELEAMGIDRVKTELSVQYVDHNLLQEDHKNPDDHLFLYSACQRFGVWFSPPGNGVSHPLHQEYFGQPGKSLLGSDSHTCAAGAIGMLAMGAGGLEVAMAMAGKPLFLKMPQVWGIRLTGKLPPWVSAKDIILEMLRRHSVKGGVDRILEYHGPGLACLSAMDRHVLANMGAELGATTTVFPADEAVATFLRAQGRAEDFQEILADPGAGYDIEDELDLDALEPLIALPTSPDNVVPVREVAGETIYQSYLGSSANPGYRDFAIAAEMVRGRHIHPGVSFDVNPTSRQILENLVSEGYLGTLVHAGARIHQAGCNGCIGMGQAPATGRLSLRTVPRNFPGRSGTKEDKVALVSPETATASALTGKLTDPRSLKIEYPIVDEPRSPKLNREMFVPPLPPEESRDVELIRGPNIKPIPAFGGLPDALELPVLLKVGNHISTDEIMPAGTRTLPFRSNISKISEFVFSALDEEYYGRANATKETGHAIVGGHNYGQGSSREHAAIAPRYLGLRVVIAKSYARIHWQNLVNFGILPLTFEHEQDFDRIMQGDRLSLSHLLESLANGASIGVRNVTQDFDFIARHKLSSRQIQLLRAGGLIPWAAQSIAQT